MNNRKLNNIVFNSQWLGEKIIFWYAFLMAFPVITPIVNLSFFIFPLLFYIYVKKFGIGLFLRSSILPILILLSVGVFVNLITVFFFRDKSYINNTITVVPNYLYWLFVVNLFYSYRDFINFKIILKGVWIGLIFSTVYYFINKEIKIHNYIPIFKVLSQNSFAFLIICFSPLSLYFLKQTKGFKIAFIFFLLFSIIGFMSGSRSGSILVFLSGFVVIFVGKIKVFKMIFFASITYIIFLLISNLSIMQKIIKSLNYRTYELLYNTEDVLKNDTSYLTRLVQIEKGITIFKEYPITGVGLNNFSSYKNVQLLGIFEGTEYIIDKDVMSSLSAHNSYISILAEGGLLIFIPFILMIFLILFKGFFLIFKMDSFQLSIFISFVTMLIHLWFISAILNVFAWFLIGITISVLYQKPMKKPNKI